MFLNQKN